MADLESFRRAGRTLFSLRLVRGADGNLSIFDGAALWITRAGSSLRDLGEGDVLAGSLEGALPGGSSDLAVHRQLYRDRGAGAIAHAHPAGSVPEGGGGPGEHGIYAFGQTLDAAVEAAVARARDLAAAPAEEPR